MVETIAPVVHGGRNRSYRTTVALHTLGATLSAAVLGALLGAAGALTGAPWGRGGLIALAVVAMLYAVREAFRLPLPLFDRRRQVPEWWRTFYSHTTAAFLYGVGLGAGFFTYLSYGTYVAVSATAFISGRPLVGALLSAPFGLARGLSVIAGRDGIDGEVVERLERTAQGSSVRLANAGVLAALGLATILSLA